MKKREEGFDSQNSIWRFFSHFKESYKWLFIVVFLSPLIALLCASFVPSLTLGREIDPEIKENIIALSGELWQHLMKTVLLEYIWVSILLILLTGLLSILWGVYSAWILSRYSFRFSNVFSYLMVLPFSIPSYVTAYVYTDFFDFSGPLQTFLRDFFHLETNQNLLGFEIRSIFGCAFVLSLNLYPYLYLFMRNSFLEQPYEIFQTTKLLGIRGWKRFVKISIPLSRPALVIGLCVIAIETLSDFVTVEYFSVQTISLSVYNIWFNMSDAMSATRLAVGIAFFVTLVMVIEKVARRNQQQFIIVSGSSPHKKIELRGKKLFIAILFLMIPLVLGFIFPLAFIIYYTIGQEILTSLLNFIPSILNSLAVSVTAAVVTILISLSLLDMAKIRRSEKRFASIQFLFALGYALPGTVLALGVLIAFSEFNNFAISFIDFFFNESLDFFVGSSIFTVIFAHALRFSIIPFGMLSASLAKVSPEIGEAAKMYGGHRLKTFFHVYWSMLERAIYTALLIVLVESIKEVPATLILRPFDFDTISTTLYGYVSDEAIEDAAIPSLLIILLSIVPVSFLFKQINQPIAYEQKNQNGETKQEGKKYIALAKSDLQATLQEDKKDEKSEE